LAANKNNMKRKWEIQQPIRTNDRGRMMQQQQHLKEQLIGTKKCDATICFQLNFTGE
jgi:hypothetical protein